MPFVFASLSGVCAIESNCIFVYPPIHIEWGCLVVWMILVCDYYWYGAASRFIMSFIQNMSCVCFNNYIRTTTAVDVERVEDQRAEEEEEQRCEYENGQRVRKKQKKFIEHRRKRYNHNASQCCNTQQQFFFSEKLDIEQWSSSLLFILWARIRKRIE